MVLKKLARVCFIVLVNFMVFFVLLESTLLLFPTLIKGNHSLDVNKFDPIFGLRIKRNINIHLSGQCWESHVTSNSIATRDLPVSELNKKHISYLFVGDSMVEGLQVDNEKLFTSLIQKALPSKAIINIAKSGAGLTYYRSFLYKYLNNSHKNIKRVYLFFFLGNDFTALLQTAPNRKGEFKRFQKHSNLYYKDYAKDRYLISMLKQLRDSLQNEDINLKSIYAMITVGARIDKWLFGNKPDENNPTLFWTRKGKWTDLVKHNLDLEFSNIQKMTNKEAIEVFILPLPAVENFMYGKDHPTYIRSKAILSEAAYKYKFKYIDLAGKLIEYAKKMNLKYPFLSFYCDGHYSEDGHKIIAENLIPLL